VLLGYYGVGKTAFCSSLTTNSTNEAKVTIVGNSSTGIGTQILTPIQLERFYLVDTPGVPFANSNHQKFMDQNMIYLNSTSEFDQSFGNYEKGEFKIPKLGLVLVEATVFHPQLPIDKADIKKSIATTLCSKLRRIGMAYIVILNKIDLITEEYQKDVVLRASNDLAVSKEDIYLIESYHGASSTRITSIDEKIQNLMQDIIRRLSYLPDRKIDTNQLKITEAYFGYLSNNDKIDVTDKLRSLIKENRLLIRPNSYGSIFTLPWKDNSLNYYFRSWRHLEVKYSYNEVKKTLKVREDEALELPVKEKK